MGHKLHLDQNEKLAMFGVTHILAIDGLSKKIVSHITIPVKNNLRIYEEVYRLVCFVIQRDGIGLQIKRLMYCMYVQVVWSANL